MEHTCEPHTSLPAPAAGCSPILSSGMSQSSQSNGIHTPAPCCENDSPACESSKGMSDPWTSRESWLASMRSALDSLVRTSVSRDLAPESLVPEADCMPRSCVQLTLFDQLGCSSKTPRPSEPVAAMSSSVTWWREDIPGATDPLPRLMLVPRTVGCDGGVLLPTPTATAAKQGAGSRAGGSSHGRPLLHAAVLSIWPTPLASDWKSHSPAKQATNSRPLREVMGHLDGGPLSPLFVEWLMGWPIGHTESSVWATAKSRSARRSRGDSSGGRE